MIKLTCYSGLVMVKQPIIVWEQKPPQVHEIVLHPSPVDLKGVNEDVFFCNISHQQVLTRTPPLCNSCGHVLGSLGICFVQIKTRAKTSFVQKEQKNENNLLIELNQMPYLDQMIQFFTKIAVRFNVYDTIHLLKKESISPRI